MTRLKLTDGTIINASDVEQAGDLLYIVTEEVTVEELAALFSNKDLTETIVLMTESGMESGYVENYTGFSGIKYTADGIKIVTLVYETKTPSNSDIDEVSQKVYELEATVNTMLGTEVE